MLRSALAKTVTKNRFSGVGGHEAVPNGRKSGLRRCGLGRKMVGVSFDPIVAVWSAGGDVLGW